MDTDKTLGLLRIARAPNAFTAMADVAAGYCMANGGFIEPARLSMLLASSAAIYSAGCVLNDLNDRDFDSTFRPERPIPSGAVTDREAGLFCILLLLCGLALAHYASGLSFVFALTLTGLVVSYNVFAKEHPLLGPFNMGLCRATNLAFGFSAAGAVQFSDWSAPFALTLFYVIALTLIARSEKDGLSARTTGALAFLAPLGAAILSFWLGSYWCAAFSLFLMALMLSGMTGLFRDAPGGTDKAVKSLILGIPVLNGAYAASFAGPAFGAAISLLALPALALSRKIKMT